MSLTPKVSSEASHSNHSNHSNSSNIHNQTNTSEYNNIHTITTTNTVNHDNIIDETIIANDIDPEFQEFVSKYGDIEVSFINPPHHNPWWTRPYALNYFHNGRLYRTRNERTSGRSELFLDLVYVGIASNLASSAVASHSGASLAKFILVFGPAWTIWADLKEFMNYYFTDDLLQRVFILWQLLLLIVYDNNCLYVDDLENITPLLTTVITYFLARMSSAIILVFYSFYIKEHRMQLRLFPLTIVCSSACWFFILMIDTAWGRAVFAAMMLFVEQSFFIFCLHPWVKKNIFKLEYSTAVNLEHEDERYNAFYIIAIGEFLLSIVKDSPLSWGWNTKLARGLSSLVSAFMFMSLYSNKDGSFQATHAIRRSATTALTFMYVHFPLIASLLVVGDAGGHLSEMEHHYLEEEEFGVLMLYQGGMLVALTALTILAMSDEDRTKPGIHKVPKWARIGMRIPVGCLILGLTWAYEELTLVKIMWLDALFLMLLMGYEFTVMNPYQYFVENRVVTVNH